MGHALAGLLQYRLAARMSPQMKVAVAIFIIGFGALLSVALTQRNLNDSAPGQSGVILYEDFASGFTASRWISLALIGTALIEIIRGFLRKRVAATADPAWPLVASMRIFYLGTLLGIAVRPDFVMHRPDPGIVPGVDWRLFGLTTHANTLGPVALLGVLLELYSPSRRKWLGRLSIGAATAVLVLAQSRTAWVAALLIAVLICVPLAIAPKRGSADERKGFTRAVWTLTCCILLLFYAACRQFVLTRSFVLSLLLLLLARCVTEAPLRSGGLLSWATFVHVLLLAVACHPMRQPVDALTARAKSLPLPDGCAGQQKWRPSRFSINLGRSTT